MKSIFKVLSILAAALCVLACTEKPGPGEEPTDDPTEKPSKMIKIKAMSFNIKYPDLMILVLRHGITERLV